MPICCVDVVLVHHSKVLLTYRNDEPAKGQWWVQGGRVFKGEKLIEAVQRKAREEIGIELKILRQLGVYEFFDAKGPFPDLKTGVHDIAVCYLAELADPNAQILMQDGTHTQWRWADHIEEGLHPYVKAVLKDANVFQ